MALQVIELFAGQDAQGQPMVERLQVRELDDGDFQLILSPVFAKGLAAGDVIKMLPESREFDLVRRSGNLSVRIFTRGDSQSLSDVLTADIEKLGGELEHETERFLTYTIHVSCGFKQLEEILNRHIGPHSQSMWLYGNVYDPADGTTPLNWWQEILQPE